MPGPPSDASIDWKQARAFLSEVVARRLDRIEPAAREDVVQDALVRLLRAVRREPPRNLEALMTEIARRASIDFIRTRQVWSVLLATSEQSDLELSRIPASLDEPRGDPGARLEFVVLEFFRVRNAPCRELALLYFSGQDWAAAARQMGIRHDAARQRWSRCVAMLREGAKGDDSPLLAWAP